MAATKNQTKRIDTSGTPVNKSDVAKLKADELRTRLKRRGVKGTAELKKPELVQKMVKALLAESRAASTKRPPTTKKTLSAPKPTDGEVAKMKVSDLRRRLASRGVKGTAELKKPDLVKKLVKALSADSKATTTKASTAPAAAKKTAAKKTVAKKAVAKKTVANKTAATKTATAAKRTRATKSTARTGEHS